MIEQDLKEKVVFGWAEKRRKGFAVEENRMWGGVGHQARNRPVNQNTSMLGRNLGAALGTMNVFSIMGVLLSSSLREDQSSDSHPSILFPRAPQRWLKESKIAELNLRLSLIRKF